MNVGDKVKNLFKPKHGEGGGTKEKSVDVEMLTEIIHMGRVKNLRSHAIANAIADYLKKMG